jgi:hypothetical protein
MKAKRYSETLINRKATRRYIPEDYIFQERLEVITAMNMRNAVFWDVTPHGTREI